MAADRDRDKPEPARRLDEPVLPQISRDETDQGWGDPPADAESEDQHFLRERPPHHEG